MVVLALVASSAASETDVATTAECQFRGADQESRSHGACGVLETDHSFCSKYAPSTESNLSTCATQAQVTEIVVPVDSEGSRSLVFHRHLIRMPRRALLAVCKWSSAELHHKSNQRRVNSHSRGQNITQIAPFLNHPACTGLHSTRELQRSVEPRTACAGPPYTAVSARHRIPHVSACTWSTASRNEMLDRNASLLLPFLSGGEPSLEFIILDASWEFILDWGMIGGKRRLPPSLLCDRPCMIDGLLVNAKSVRVTESGVHFVQKTAQNASSPANRRDVLACPVPSIISIFFTGNQQTVRLTHCQCHAHVPMSV
eukprot:891968-Rhodomonas_salina.2